MAEEKDPKVVMELDEESCEEEEEEDDDYDRFGFYLGDEESDHDLSGERNSYERKLAEDHTLYVKHFSDAATIQEITDAFGKYGKIVGIQMKSEDGSCLVNYARPEEAYAAIQALNRVHTLPGGQHPIRVVRETSRTMALRHAASFLELCSLVKENIEKGEVTNISVDDIDIGDPSVEDLSWTLMQNLQGEELLQMADKGTKRKKPREGGNEKRGKKIKKSM